uniref:DH domain-containing protein n=1 Tax=Varanus komodoensis TaxID=61221 RepID=A0A8D2LF15_VARKO
MTKQQKDRLSLHFWMWVLEFVNTEASYGEDLRIIKEEFYLPMQAAGLLTQDQLLVVFSNIQELIDLNESFLEYLQEEIDQAFEQVVFLGSGFPSLWAVMSYFVPLALLAWRLQLCL